jgi:UDP-glucose 4-epimerase
LKALVTGAAGFIGSHLTDRLLQNGHSVVGFDNLSTGREQFLEHARRSSRFQFVRGDLLDQESINSATDGVDIVFHLAANADVRFGTQHPRKDLEQNTICTSNVLEAMRLGGVKRIAFSSTGSVYGESAMIPTPEDAPFPVQTSFYGASKAAGEALISAYCEGFGMTACIFRFVSILGPRYTHGHVFDFYRQLAENPKHLRVLGNGRQRKSYLDVQDCIDAILLATETCQNKVSILNLGTDQYCEVNDSIGWICEHLQVRPKIEYTGGERGWIGDNPFIFLDCARMRSLGWEPKFSIRQGVLRTLEYFQQTSDPLRSREPIPAN